MAALTWRDVAAPNFGGSLDGINQFSRLLDQSLQGAERAVGRYDAAQDEMANRAINERSLAIRDPAALAAAIADGSILGSDRFRASTSTLQALDNRVGALQQEGLGRINLETAGRTNDQAKAFDAAAPDIAEYTRLRETDPKAAEAYRQAHPNLANPALGGRNILSIQRGGLDAETGGLANSNTRQAMDLAMRREGRDADLFGREKTEWGENRAAQSLMAQAYRDGVTMDDMPEYLAAHGISGVTAARLIGISNGVLPANMGGGSVGGGGGGSGDPLSTVNYQARGAGFGSVPASVQTMGDASKYADSINSAGVASSAMGPYQIVGNTRDRLAQQEFGKNWRDVPYSMENETRIATRLFNSVKGDPAALRKQWVSLSPAEAERVSRMSAPDALAIIAQKESGATPEQLAAGNPSARAAAIDARTRAGTGQRIANIGGGNFDQARAAAKGDIDSSAIDVATRLKDKLPGTDGWWTNTSVRDIADDVKAIRDRAIARASAAGNKNYNMTFAEAGVIYENNTKSRWVPYALGGKDLDYRGVDAAIDRGISGADQDAVGALALARGNAAARDASSATLAQARANLTAARQRVRDPAILARYERAYQQAAQADQLNQGYEGNNNPIDSYGTSSADAARTAGVSAQQAQAKATERRQIAEAMTAARAGQQWPKGIPSRVWYYALDQVQKGH